MWFERLPPDNTGKFYLYSYRSILIDEYYQEVCLKKALAEKFCPYYYSLKENEEISKKMMEFTEKLVGLARRLKS